MSCFAEQRDEILSKDQESHNALMAVPSSVREICKDILKHKPHP